MEFQKVKNVPAPLRPRDISEGDKLEGIFFFHLHRESKGDRDSKSSEALCGPLALFEENKQTLSHCLLQLRYPRLVHKRLYCVGWFIVCFILWYFGVAVPFFIIVQTNIT